MSSLLTNQGMLAGFPAGLLIWFLLIALVVACVWIVLARRKLDRHTRAIVQSLEEMRTGTVRGRAVADADSPLSGVSDAVHRLGHDLHGRYSAAEKAAERWRALSDAARDTAVVTTDNDGDIRSFSAGATELFGWDEDEVISRPAAVIFEESSYKDLLPKLARRSLRKQGVTARSTLLRRDGSDFAAEISVRLLTSGSSRDPVGFMLVIRDVTQQVRLEQELRDSEGRYRGLVEGLAEGVMIVQQGRLAYVNPAGAKLCGQEARELVETPLRDRIATCDLLLVEERIAALERREPVDGRLRCSLVDPDGGARAEVLMKGSHVEFAGSPAVLLLVEDETAERRIEGELRRNESRLDAVLEATSDGILVTNGTVRLANRALAVLFGFNLDELLGSSEQNLLSMLRARADGGEQVADLVESGGAAPVREVITLGGAVPRSVQVSVSPLRGRGGERLGRILACRDLTDQRQSEQQLQSQAEQLQLSKVELEQSYRRLNEVNARLQTQAGDLDRLNRELRRLDEMKSNLLGNVSHELQTPLVSIRGYTEMILKERLGPIGEEQRKGLELSLKNIDRLISMIDNLLAFTRTDPEVGSLKLSRFQLRPVIQEARDLLRDKIHARQLDLTVDLENEQIQLHADRDKVLQVFLNLLSNATKFNHRGGAIAVEARLGQPGYVTARVRDTGVGIPRESLERIFERRYQAPGSATARREGEGIGLAIVRDILRMHGCTIRVQSEPQRGAEFTFTLPLAEERAEAEPPTAPEEPPAPVPADEAGDPAAREARPRLRIIRRRQRSD